MKTPGRRDTQNATKEVKQKDASAVNVDDLRQDVGGSLYACDLTLTFQNRRRLPHVLLESAGPRIAAVSDERLLAPPRPGAVRTGCYPGLGVSTTLSPVEDRPRWR